MNFQTISENYYKHLWVSCYKTELVCAHMHVCVPQLAFNFGKTELRKEELNVMM